jgi:hypothetical protein
MANTAAMCSSFKKEILLGIHALGTTVVRGATTVDTFNAALYLASATLNAATTVYTTTGEVANSTTYAAGGIAVTNANPPTNSTTNAIWTPSASLAFGTNTFAVAFDTCLIYNATQGNKAVGVFTFGSQTVTAGVFTLTMPVNAAGTALLQIS